MATINEVLERTENIRTGGFEDAVKAGWLLELEGKLFREVILRHRMTGSPKRRGAPRLCPLCGSGAIDYDHRLDAGTCADCGWSEIPKYPQAYPEDGDMPMLAEAPYDNLYDLYVFAMTDYHRHETANYLNSMTMFNEAMDEWRKAYHRAHMPLGIPGFIV